MTARRFTLIEILVAVALFVSAMTPLLMVMTASSEVFRDNIKKSQATMFASEKLAELKGRTDIQWSPLAPPSWRDPAGGALTEVPQYPGLYYVVVGRYEMNGLGLVKLGVTYRPPLATVAEANWSRTDRTMRLTSAPSPLKMKLYQNGRYAYVVNGGGSDGDIFSYGGFDPATTNLTGVVGVVGDDFSGTVYLLDEVFTLWHTDL